MKIAKKWHLEIKFLRNLFHQVLLSIVKINCKRLSLLFQVFLYLKRVMSDSLRHSKNLYLIWSIIWKILTFVQPKIIIILLILISFLIISAVNFVEKPQLETFNFQREKHGYLIYSWTDKAFQSLSIKHAINNIHGKYLEITISAPLMKER